jgi:hypothetical protein
MGRASRRKRELRKRRKKDSKDLDRFAESLTGDSELPVVIHRNPASRKVSDALVTLIRPWLGGEESLEEYRGAAQMGVIAWNLSLLDPRKRKKQLARALKKVARSDAAVFRQMLEEMLARKRELFPQDRRWIVGVEVTDRGDQFHIMAASTEME